MSEGLTAWRHIYLYAKGHYRREGILTDLRIIVGRGVACEPQHISNTDILDVVYEVVSPYLTDTVRSMSFLTVLWNLLDVSRSKDRPLIVEDIVAELLSILSVIRVRGADGKEFIKLGAPDYTLLPRPE